MSESKREPATAEPRVPENTAGVLVYVAALTGLTSLAVVWEATSVVDAPGRASLLAWPALVCLLVAAEYLFVRFRYRGDINGLNMVEAALAPLIFGFETPVVVATVVVCQIVAGIARRNAPVKIAFNVAQWSLSSAVGSIIAGVPASSGVSWGSLGALVLGLAATAVLNQIAFTLVLSIANRRSMRHTLSGLAPVILPGWLLPWAINTLLGLLFVLAYATHALSSYLFLLPLSVLHLAYRGYAGARSDRVRLTGLHRAARILSGPVDPTIATEGFLREVAASFEARGAELIVKMPDGVVVHSFDVDANEFTTTTPVEMTPFESMLMEKAAPLRVRAHDKGRDSLLLAQTGRRECLAAPFEEGGQTDGVLAVFDQIGLEGFEAGELSALDALARQTGTTLARGKLMQAIIDERQKYAHIFDSTSDGVVTIDQEGIIRSWNAAMESISGLSSDAVVGRREGLTALAPKTQGGEPVDLAGWAAHDAPLPRVVEVATTSGTALLSCSYSHPDKASGLPLVIIARDITPSRQVEELQREMKRMAAAEAAQRALVEQLQQAIMPARPELGGTDLGLCYVSSDPTSPTGGDLYDWQPLPTGELHLAVIDVLGHGVTATKDALTVIHTLRLLAMEDCPIDDMVARADSLLGAQERELVATVVVARYNPATGLVSLAGGGHPPPLYVTSSGATEIAISGGAIGWPGAGSDSVADVQLRHGDAIVFYTDGLIEAGKDIVAGMEGLRRSAEEMSDYDAQTLSDALVDVSLSGGVRRDDSLALTLRCTKVESLPMVTWKSTPNLRHLRRLRKDVAAWMRSRFIDEEEIEAVILGASELLTNAMKAARTSVRMTASLEGSRLAVIVEDDGLGDEGLDSAGLLLPSSKAEKGRGLFVVRSIFEAVEIESGAEGTRVRCWKDVSLDLPAAESLDSVAESTS